MTALDFRWIEWNLDKLGKHNVTPSEAEYVVNHASRPFPRRLERDKRLVWGRTASGDYLQVIYLMDEDETVFVIHARPLTEREKRRMRRRLR